MTGKTKSEDGNHEAAKSAATAEQAARNPSGGTNAGHSETNDGRAEAFAKLEAENTDLKDRLLRALAEVENVRRRADRDLNDTRQYAVAKFAGDMLRVADNMGRAIASIPAEALKDEGAFKTLIDGIELTEKEMLRSLEKHGVKKLNPIGERFDPNFHEALFELPDPSVPNGTVTQVVEPGYVIGSRPLRPAKVGIARGGIQSQPAPRGEGEPKG
ncbi:nucleotide exchange factor GrpE [Rhizobium sp. ICMP 5592]|uniref:nucleotide exchange factor GrpE n=1 Tax=Rhizobium sp. ICMP 5592 TaxID=2292445 RepID=UPI001297A5A6|nr:nucleotide exchange factor GrpE [Rhizobium sp. ICMP 5592]MQB44999.1 nucleotide exchange factor GrpE [Rhizobium sp. ICMP 5592]